MTTFRKAKKQFATLCSRGHVREAFESFVSKIWAEPRLFSNLLQACIGLKSVSLGKQLHSLILISGCSSEKFISNHLLNLYSKFGELRAAVALFDRMPRRNIMSSQKGSFGGVLDQYCMMKKAGFRPDKITFVSVISSCSELAILGQGKQIHAEAIKAGASYEVSVVSSLVSMYSRCGCLQESFKSFLECKERDVVLWSSMIAAYGFHGQGEKAIKLFNQMEQENMPVNELNNNKASKAFSIRASLGERQQEGRRGFLKLLLGNEGVGLQYSMNLNYSERRNYS
ncbi:Pentatricopeptide repeat-containing protein [Vigna angularis]|uniref:Pentatricopeptide repeat-containing protein n=1 Tax=Phaseolus angularis TaxID=3914 RepID=A0A8T0KYG9_PHAAN|nr:Pentatricopeptide repeat-containing protein [Vigna angularis]